MRGWVHGFRCILRPFGGFCLHCHKNGIDRTAGKMPLQFRCALWGTIFIQAAHRICKPGQAGGGNGLGEKHIPVTETALRRKRKGLTSPFSYSENRLESGEIRGNMLTRWFAFVPPPYVGRMTKNFRPVLEFSVLRFCLSFPKSGRFVPYARKTENFCRYKK